MVSQIPTTTRQQGRLRLRIVPPDFSGLYLLKPLLVPVNPLADVQQLVDRFQLLVNGGIAKLWDAPIVGAD